MRASLVMVSVAIISACDGANGTSSVPAPQDIAALSACDTVAWVDDYLGPAALNRAWTLHNDVRDGGRAERLKAISGSGGCQACHSHQSCFELCPKHLNPTASIAGLKRATVKAALKGEI